MLSKFRNTVAALMASGAMLAPSLAHAALVISNRPTRNVSCSAGVCTATAEKAVLNVTDLANLIAASPVTIQSGSLARDIVFNASFSWTSSNALTLDAANSIQVKKPVSDAGAAPLTLVTAPGGRIGPLLSFIDKGRISFLGTSNAFAINSQLYTLVDSLPALISATNANPSGYFALVRSYDAKPDGNYMRAPIAQLKGTFEGLGNAISNLSIKSRVKSDTVGLVGINYGTIDNLLVNDANISSKGEGSVIGALVGLNMGFVGYSHSSGVVTGGEGTQIGGLVGQNMSGIAWSSSAANVTARANSEIGGLAGSSKFIDECFATGAAKEVGPSEEIFTDVGGLVGWNDGGPTNSYATGAASADGVASVGGLMGYAGSETNSSYSTGRVSAAISSQVGGFVGLIGGVYVADYWNTETSGQKQGTGSGDRTGVTGLTTKQFKSGLPAGFDPKTWAQDPSINNGYPYLIANPPAK